ncbi:MAG: hypothetical protein ACO1OK_11235 [Devosia sp.]
MQTTANHFRSESPRILIAEDLPLIAMDLEQGLLDLCAARTGTVRTVVDFERALQQFEWDVVLTETHLAGASTAPLVEALLARGTRVIVCSAERSPHAPFDRARSVTKPYDWRELAGLLEAALPPSLSAAF